MKKTILTITLIFAFIIGGFAKSNPNVLDYVVTENDVIYVTKLRTGHNKLVGITDSGEKINFEKSEVKAYRKNGKEFKKMEVNNEKIFLERMKTRAGYTMYKKINFKSIKDIFVYREGKLVHQLNKENYKIILGFFFAKFNQLFFG